MDTEELTQIIIRENAKRYLSNWEKELINFVETKDIEIAINSKSVEEYFQVNKENTPICEAGKYFNLSPLEVEKALLHIERKLITFIEDNNI